VTTNSDCAVAPLTPESSRTSSGGEVQGILHHQEVGGFPPIFPDRAVTSNKDLTEVNKSRAVGAGRVLRKEDRV